MSLQEYLDGKEHPWFCQGVDGEREPLCLPQLPCVRETPYGKAEGLKCVLGTEVNHNTTWDAFPKIIEEGMLKPGARDWVLGQDAISLSSCPPQSYGGTIKFIFDSEKLDLRPMCYVDFSYVADPETGRSVPGPWDKVEKGLSKEANEPLYPGEATDTRPTMKGSWRVSAEYGINRAMYKDECEYLTYEPIPLDKLKRIEFWIAARIMTEHEASFDCARGLGPFANIHGNDLEYYMMKRVKEAKEETEKLGVDFKVRSCFPLLKDGRYGGKYIELTEKNLNKIAQGELPESEHIDSKEVYNREKYKCFC